MWIDGDKLKEPGLSQAPIIINIRLPEEKSILTSTIFYQQALMASQMNIPRISMRRGSFFLHLATKYVAQTPRLLRTIVRQSCATCTSMHPKTKTGHRGQVES
ncbi:hypothetical protein CTAM01_08633 [Colletotrichum tamarilloi]|uniref:Uncharacterized protein n=1 Tax=Colletotrichum tamarilloi TaxID=1209934 RepID=A0ABQ9R5C4_9PEZI|nr:uncharacterized protein CTAM01_08633 [Colletotrichum tamarilloi]KAK1495178.1 hypothetical protein CTAM01_08633 [Colletotrichum tamarilloi]